MISTRKLTFQLTPLLDLLLIVIFAQYMDVQETTKAAQEKVAQELREVQQGEQTESRQLTALKEQLSGIISELNQTKQEALELEQENEALNQTLTAYGKQQEKLGSLVSELFKVPEELIEETLSPTQQANATRSEAELKRLRTEFQELAKANALQTVKHLVAHNELLKRTEIWEVDLQRTGLVSFKVDTVGREPRVVTFRYFEAERIPQLKGPGAFEKFLNESADLFADQLVQAQQDLPEPKSLVILLFSYDVYASEPMRDAAIDGVRKAVNKLRMQHSGRSRFEYALLGYPES